MSSSAIKQAHCMPSLSHRQGVIGLNDMIISTANTISSVSELLQQPKKTILFLISVGQDYHEDEKLKAQINYFENLICACVKAVEDPRAKDQSALQVQNAKGDWDIIVMVADTLQAYNDTSDQDKDVKLSHWHDLGKEYVERNRDAFLQLERIADGKINVKVQFVYWQEALDKVREPFDDAYQTLLKAYQSNTPHHLRQAINDKGFSYLERNGLLPDRFTASGKSEVAPVLPANNLRYILEELIVLYQFGPQRQFGYCEIQSPLYLVYPNSEENAFIEARKFFKTTDKVHWLALKCHDQQLRKLPSIYGRSGAIEADEQQKFNQYVYQELFSLKAASESKSLSLPDLPIDIEREHYHQQIASAFSHHDVVICHGMGGVGKSHLVSSYALKNQKQFTLCMWSTQNKLDSSFAGLAGQLGIADKRDKQKEIIVKVRQYLEENPGWLLVFDNVEDVKSIRRFLPSKGGKVLITTRLSNLDLDNSETLEITCMSAEEANSLMQKLSGRASTDLREIVSRLGNLPLALVYAGSYLKEFPDMSVKEYLRLYEEYDSEISAAPKKMTSFQSKSILAAWKASVHALKRSVKDKSYFIERLFILLSLLEHSSIDIMILKKWYQDTNRDLYVEHPKLLEEIIDECIRLSLLKGPYIIEVHPVFQDMQLQEAQSHPARIKGIVHYLSIHYRTMAKSGKFHDKKHILESLPHMRSVLNKAEHYSDMTFERGNLNYAIAQLYAYCYDHLSVKSLKQAQSNYALYFGMQSTSVAKIGLDIFETYIRMGAYQKIPKLIHELEWLASFIWKMGISPRIIELSLRYDMVKSVFYSLERNFGEAYISLKNAQRLSDELDKTYQFRTRIKLEIVKLGLATGLHADEAREILLRLSEAFYLHEITSREKMEIVDFYIDWQSHKKNYGWMAYFLNEKLGVQTNISVELAANDGVLNFRIAKAYLAMGYNQLAYHHLVICKNYILAIGSYNQPESWAMLCEYAQLCTVIGKATDDVHHYISSPYAAERIYACDNGEQLRGAVAYCAYMISMGETMPAGIYLKRLIELYPSDKRKGRKYQSLIALRRIAAIADEYPKCARQLLGLEQASYLIDPDSEELVRNVKLAIPTFQSLTRQQFANVSHIYSEQMQKLDTYLNLRHFIVSNRFISDCIAYIATLVQSEFDDLDLSDHDSLNQYENALSTLREMIPNCGLDEVDALTFANSDDSSEINLTRNGRNAFSMLYEYYRDMIEQDKSLFNALMQKSKHISVYKRPPIDKMLSLREQCGEATLLYKENENPMLANSVSLHLSSKDTLHLKDGSTVNSKFAEIFLGRGLGYFRKFLTIKLAETLPSGQEPPIIEIKLGEHDQSAYQVKIKLIHFAIYSKEQEQQFLYICNLSLYLAGLTPLLSLSACQFKLPYYSSLTQSRVTFFHEQKQVKDEGVVEHSPNASRRP